MKRIVATVLALTMALGLAACGGGGSSTPAPGDNSEAPAGRTEVLTLKLGALGSGREDDCQSYPINKFIEIVEEKTNGMIKIQYFPNGQLGGEPEMLDQVLSDSLDIGVLSANVLATVWPELYAYNLPFAFDDLEQLWDICGFEAGPYYDAMKGAVDDSGLAHFMSTFSAEFRGCQNAKRPVRSPADFKGLTFRVMAGEVVTDIFQSLGASTATVTFAELYLWPAVRPTARCSRASWTARMWACPCSMTRSFTRWRSSPPSSISPPPSTLWSSPTGPMTS